MTTLRSPAVGDIWLAYVEFSDHPGVGEVRPVVVVDVWEDACVVVAVKVTSKDLRANLSSGCLPIIGWEHFGLRKPSYIRLDQRFELAFEKLLRDKPIGVLPDSYFRIVTDAIRGIDSSA